MLNPSARIAFRTGRGMGRGIGGGKGGVEAIGVSVCGYTAALELWQRFHGEDIPLVCGRCESSFRAPISNGWHSKCPEQRRMKRAGGLLCRYDERWILILGFPTAEYYVQLGGNWWTTHAEGVDILWGSITLLILDLNSHPNCSLLIRTSNRSTFYLQSPIPAIYSSEFWWRFIHLFNSIDAAFWSIIP